MQNDGYTVACGKSPLHATPRCCHLTFGIPMSTGKLLYAQSGGVTSVINATASAVIETARQHKVKVLAARNGLRAHV